MLTGTPLHQVRQLGWAEEVEWGHYLVRHHPFRRLELMIAQLNATLVNINQKKGAKRIDPAQFLLPEPATELSQKEKEFRMADELSSALRQYNVNIGANPDGSKQEDSSTGVRQTGKEAKTSTRRSKKQNS